MPDSPTPAEIRARLRELGYLKNPLDRFVFGGGSTGGALKLALGAGLRGALIAGPLLAGFGIILLGDELAPDEILSWFLAFTILFGLVIFLWVIAQALLIHFVAARRNRSLESLPVLIMTLSAAGLLLPALLWLLASGRIHSATLGGGFGGALLAAVVLLAVASFAIFSSIRAASIFAAGNLESIARSRGGLRSVIFGFVLFAMIGGVLWRKQQFKSDAASVPIILTRDWKKAKGNSLRIIAVDGVHVGDLAPALGSGAIKLTDIPFNRDLLAGWMKIQSGQREWQPQHFTGYRASWGGRAHAESEAPGRLLRLLAPIKLARLSPLPGKFSRPMYFWEVPAPALALVVGGWQTFPINSRVTNIISDRMFYALAAGVSPEGLYQTRHLNYPSILEQFRSLPQQPAGLQLDEFHRRLFNANYYYVGGDVCFATFGPSWVYLPGADIVCGKSESQCDLAKSANADFIRSLGEHQALLLIENPGRQGGTGAIWFRPAKDEKIRPVHAPEELAAAVLDYLGYPLSAELAGVKPEEAQIASYGRIVVEDSGESDDATLKALKSLGYLQ